LVALRGWVSQKSSRAKKISGPIGRRMKKEVVDGQSCNVKRRKRGCQCIYGGDGVEKTGAKKKTTGGGPGRSFYERKISEEKNSIKEERRIAKKGTTAPAEV